MQRFTSGFTQAFTSGTDGPIQGTVVVADIQSRADFDAYRGRLKDTIADMKSRRDVLGAPGEPTP